MKKLALITLIAAFGLTASVPAFAQMNVEACRKENLTGRDCLKFLNREGGHPRAKALNEFQASKRDRELNPNKFKDIDSMRGHFSKMFAVLENIAGLNNEKVSALKKRLAEIKNNDELKNVAEDAKRLIKESFRERRGVLIGLVNKISNNLVNIAEKRAAKISKALDILAKDGKDVAGLKANLATATDLIATAKADLKKIKDLLASNTDLNWDTVHQDLKAVFDKIKTAYEQFKTIVAQAKDLRGETESENE